MTRVIKTKKETSLCLTNHYACNYIHNTENKTEITSMKKLNLSLVTTKVLFFISNFQVFHRDTQIESLMNNENILIFSCNLITFYQ